MSRRVCGGLEFQEVGLELLVRQPSGWEFYYSRDIFCVEGFLLQRPDWRVTYCNGLLGLYVFTARNVVNFLFNYTFLTICAESAVKPKSVN